jgi:hypothetical protein
MLEALPATKMTSLTAAGGACGRLAIASVTRRRVSKAEALQPRNDTSCDKPTQLDQTATDPRNRNTHLLANRGVVHLPRQTPSRAFANAVKYAHPTSDLIDSGALAGAVWAPDPPWYAMPIVEGETGEPPGQTHRRVRLRPPPG